MYPKNVPPIQLSYEIRELSGFINETVGLIIVFIRVRFLMQILDLRLIDWAFVRKYLTYHKVKVDHTFIQHKEKIFGIKEKKAPSPLTRSIPAYLII